MRLSFFLLLVVMTGSVMAGNLSSSSLGCTVTRQQDRANDSLVYYERMHQGRYRFFFDDRYYLAEKSCGFMTTIREAGFDPGHQVFDGPFTDYNLAGQKILTGNYNKGTKTGVFQAFHPNGQLKWEVNFTDGQPAGLWQYYYPDGRPMLVLDYNGEEMEFRDYWDLKGKHRVQNGKGRYQMRVEIDGYNEFGAVYVLRRGRVKNGKPDRVWSLDLIYPDDTSDRIGNDRYQNGQITEQAGYGRLLNDYLSGSDRFSLVPQSWFVRAEDLERKKCTIDEYSGFTVYLMRYLEDALKSIQHPERPAQQVAYTVSVNKDGMGVEVSPVAHLSDGLTERWLLQRLRAIDFWHPSFLDGEYIDDELTVRFVIGSDELTGMITIERLDIQRKNGF